MSRGRATLIPRQAAGLRTLSAPMAFPRDHRDFLIVLDDAELSNAEVRVEIELSFDQGRTWRFDAGFTADGTHKGRSNETSIRYDAPLDPTPTHYRVSMEPVRGFPRCGVKG